MDGIIAKKQKNNINNIKHNPNVHVEIVPQKQYHVYQLGKAFEVDDFDDVDYYDDDFSAAQETEDVAYEKVQEQNRYTSNEWKSEVSKTEQINDLYEGGFFEGDIEENKYEEAFDDEGVFRTHDADFYDDEDCDKVKFSLVDLPIFAQESILMPQRVTARFAIFAVIVTIVLGSFLFVGTTFAVKDRVDGAGKRAINSIEDAMNSLSTGDFVSSSDELASAHEEFIFASEEMNKINGFVKFVSQFIPGASKLASGNHIVEAGKYLTHSATELHAVIPTVIDSESALVSGDGVHISFLALYELLADHAAVASTDITKAREHIDKVHLDDVPEEYRDTFVKMKDALPLVETTLIKTVDSRAVVEALLGARRRQTYLFLFQNNQEMRATGGFIGSYGILEINNGQIQKLVVDDIFNPDGQLIDRVVPPLPIQKISADWSLHDSNWFVDFPLSAKKAMDFYERTGGPTVDGVIAITPAMLQKFLEITGPIGLPEHNVILTSNNFMKILQNEVEDKDNYSAQQKEIDDQNKENNSKENESVEVEKKHPKKILSDLMPIMVDKLSNKKNPEDIGKLLNAVSSGLKERHIIMYMSDKGAQDIIENNGWSGSVLQTDKDYLSVVNSNINGFKTDGVVDEYITHTAEIDENGDIIDTVSIRRVHRGGKTGFPWWDAVNSNYMRVYVPQGAELLSVEGQTREINEERLNYDALGYERDKDVEKEENNMYIDEETGTRIYDEYNKTVFANWVYVSPQESVTITYKYKLPFQADFNSDQDGKFGSYAVLYQKQSGSEKSHIKSEILLDDNFSQVWSSQNNEDTTMENKLDIDRYHGTVFRVN
jgi:hypothetical protein